MAKDKETKAVIEILRGFGFSSCEIPEEPQRGRRADIRSVKDAESYLIEVKSKEDHPEFSAALKKTNDLEIVPYEKQLRRSNTFGKIIREGVGQLEETPDNAQSFKCIWFRAIEALFTDAFAFMKSTLYGTRILLVVLSATARNILQTYEDLLSTVRGEGSEETDEDILNTTSVLVEKA